MVCQLYSYPHAYHREIQILLHKRCWIKNANSHYVNIYCMRLMAGTTVETGIWGFPGATGAIGERGSTGEFGSAGVTGGIGGTGPGGGGGAAGN